MVDPHAADPDIVKLDPQKKRAVPFCVSGLE